jgi:hypothetical protein
MTASQIRERRKLPRIFVNRGIVAVLNSSFYQVGPLIDISRGGCSMSYHDSNISVESNVIVDVLIMGKKDVYLRQIPGRILATCDVADDCIGTSSKSKRCCICFNALTSEQETELSRFIESKRYPTA